MGEFFAGIFATLLGVCVTGHCEKDAQTTLPPDPTVIIAECPINASKENHLRVAGIGTDGERFQAFLRPILSATPGIDRKIFLQELGIPDPSPDANIDGIMRRYNCDWDAFWTDYQRRKQPK